MGKKKELKRRAEGSYLSRTNATHKTSREKRITPTVVIRKTIIERIKPLGWGIIAVAVGIALGLIVTNI